MLVIVPPVNGLSAVMLVTEPALVAAIVIAPAVLLIETPDPAVSVFRT